MVELTLGIAGLIPRGERSVTIGGVKPCFRFLEIGEWRPARLVVGAAGPAAPGITKLAAEPVTRLLDMGADRNVLCHLARAICFEAITRTFATLEDTGTAWPDAEPDWESLQMAMTQAATLGKDNRLGGRPAR